MEQKTEVCGIQLDNLSVSDALSRLETFFGKGRLHVVVYVYAELMRQMVQEESFGQDVLSCADLVLVGEKAVAQVLEQPCMMTDEELDRHLLANTFLTICASEMKTIYWIGETEEEYRRFRAYADKFCPQLQVTGAFAVGTDLSSETEEALVNDVNRVAPDVIISRLPSPYQEQFVTRQRLKMNAQIWLGLSSKANLYSEAAPRSSKIKALIDRRLLKRVVNANKEA